ncbi:MAG: hypothetical protein ACTSU5_11125, partial [Promethearchaeota archaeon]
VYQPFDQFDVILDSLKKLSALSATTVFCSHDGVISDGSHAILDKIAHMEEVKDRVLELHELGKTPKEITREVVGKEDILARITRGHMSKLNCVKSILYGKEVNRIE